jgi:hypothetical protein
MLAVLLGMTALSGFIGWSSHSTISRVYDETVRTFAAAGKPAPPNPFAYKPRLSLLNNMTIYVRPVPPSSYFWGKIGGSALAGAAIMATCLALSAIGLTLASYDFKAQVADYTAYVQQAKAAGATIVAAPQFFPLQLLRGVIEYVQIIGAVLAIGLGYLSVARERTGKTTPLILTRPVRTRELFLGRLLGAAALVTTILAVTAVISVVGIGVAGGRWLNGAELVKLAIVFGSAVIYMLLFYALGTWLCARSRVVANGLVVALVIWLSVVLIIPQIGDTMDPDNQVPGGLFATSTRTPSSSRSWRAPRTSSRQRSR